MKKKKAIIVIIVMVLVSIVAYVFVSFNDCVCPVFKIHCPNDTIKSKEVKNQWHCFDSCFIPYCDENPTENNDFLIT